MLHGHGAKGAALARLTPSAPQAIRVYTPHGGSLVYSPGTLRGGFYRKLEWLLIGRTDLFLFESSYAADLFRAKIGRPRAMVRVVRNGVGDAEFAPITARPDATDIVSVGELRPVKAIDVLVEALAVLKRSGRPVTATIAGEGPQGADLKAQAERLGIADLVRFVGYRPAREAFAMGRMLVIPSRAESLPYIVLEAAAAGMPIIATKVGGNPEIFGAQADHLITPDDSAALVARSPRRSATRTRSSASRTRCEPGCAASSPRPRWSKAALPPTAKPSPCKNWRNSRNRFLRIFHYFGPQSTDGGVPPGVRADNAGRSCPSPSTARSSRRPPRPIQP